MTQPTGRFAPSPSGRMHLGNVFTALVSWLSVRKSGGRWILRIEDLDPQRSKPAHARQIEDDLRWLGLDWDEGGVDGTGDNGPYVQSRRGHIYERALHRLREMGLMYPCTCRRADILATQAPHESDGRIVYAGTCRPAGQPPFSITDDWFEGKAQRICVPDRKITFDDRVFGRQSVNLRTHCGDFVIRRADGAWSYQLAVVTDDAMMGVTEVVRGCDLLLSGAQQLYLYETLGYRAPRFVHLPLLCNESGQRLSKRDASLSLGELRHRLTPAELIGRLAYDTGLTTTPDPCTPQSLIATFDLTRIHPVPSIPIDPRPYQQA